ncbi:MAG: MogA/MoaB family molybdenum cofactor biosynthesis protein [Candidatus Latescibacterota bacterium]|nr:MAG: MogA/MoaB family molybdenum cofactor biosynthesis protein [Candidatus Latescibacterota bacterium]
MPTSAILISSDRAASGIRPDRTTALLSDKLSALGFDVVHNAVVPDDKLGIVKTLRAWVNEGIEVILISGGTGVAPTDVTPEATLEVITRRVPGMEEAMRRVSHEKTPFAMLARGVVGIARSSLVINLPGSPTGAVENLEVVAPVLEHALELIQGGTPDG